MFSKAVICLVTFLSFGTMAIAQSFSQDRLSDWEFRFYACKSVLTSAVLVIDIMEEQQITDQSGIDAVQAALGRRIANAVVENEKNFQFVEGESVFLSDLTFAVVSSMVYAGFELSATQLFQSGNDICIHTIETMAK